MYDLKKIASFIDNPSLIDEADIDSLRNLAIEQSYSPIFSILYLKAIKKHLPLQFESELKKHAFKIPSREQLFNIIEESGQKTPKVNEKKEQKEIKESTEEVDSIVQHKATNNLGNDKKQEELTENKSKPAESTGLLDEKDSTVNSKEATSFEKQQDNQFNTSQKSTVIVDEKMDEEPTLANKEATHKDDGEGSKKNLDPLEQEILSSAVGATLHLEIEELAKEFENSNKEKVSPEKDDVKIEFDLANTEAFREELVSKDDATSNTKKEAEQEVDFKTNRSFTDWLMLGEENADKITREKKSNPSERKKIKSEKNIEKISQEKKVEKEFFSATKKAKESLDYSKIPMTETLAKVYEAQGNFPRAIEAYTQLILKNPEKKVFFALQIEKLKKKINN